ncbi:MarR family transcriptional regulator [Corynebacterium sp. MSK006]|uniref:MarR family transcriptional regulator n=1 Tax=Corynebacterium sp. MSK006 TaxID=3050187 RepID=UPI00254EBFBC|nr:MarR family transcriptional regulator [Corynebacterium sp. MSK006]MDK8895747.1 MarR family transcriptional regulator [Corynebacterium sp. MSK006]
MLALHARYRGRSTRRAELVRRSAEALATLPGVGEFERLGVEDIRARVETPESLCDTVMALLSDGEWALGVGVTDAAHDATEAATAALGRAARPGLVRARVLPDATGTVGEDIAAVFLLLGQVLAKRSLEGREATSLMRTGMNQIEAAERLGITKQAISQRLRAAGWQAENAGWQLAVNLITAAQKAAPEND